MDTAIAIPRPVLSAATAVAFFALVVMFLIGGFSGYVLRAMSGPASTPPPPRASAACPAGSHAVVYYSAGTWSCVDN